MPGVSQAVRSDDTCVLQKPAEDPQMAAAIEVTGLVKSYGQVRALRGIDLHVDAGEIVAVLGPNGAGKTTAVEILEGFRSRDAGEVSVLGLDPRHGGRALRERVGIVLQSCGIDPFLTVREVVTLNAGYYPNPRSPDEVIDLMGLAEKAKSRVKTLSGGQQRRVDLALGLVGDPELIFLDEPTTGFDPSARRGAWDIVANLRTLGKTVLLTTHYMDEAQHLADRVVVIAAGQVVAEGPPGSIGGRASAQTVIRFTLPTDASADSVPVAGQIDGGAFEIVVEPTDATATLHQLTGWALDRGTPLDDLTVARPSLEDVYLELTDRGSETEQ
jgi:ABC-2 type transport system ATP-binding protein